MTDSAAVDRQWRALEQQRRLESLDDSVWRQQALASIRTIRVGPRRNARPPSLVDQILCAAIEEPTARVGRLVTSDPTDFRVSCAHVGVQIVTLQQWAEELGIRR